MLRHAEGLQQMYDKTRFTKNCTTNYHKSYGKMYDISLAVIRQHQACMK